MVSSREEGISVDITGASRSRHSRDQRSVIREEEAVAEAVSALWLAGATSREVEGAVAHGFDEAALTPEPA